MTQQNLQACQAELLEVRRQIQIERQTAMDLRQELAKIAESLMAQDLDPKELAYLARVKAALSAPGLYRMPSLDPVPAPEAEPK